MGSIAKEKGKSMWNRLLPKREIYTLLTPTTTFFKGNLVGEIGEVGVSRV